jgi:hypothetical protein
MVKEIIIALILTCCSVEQMHAQDFEGPDTVSIQSGKLTLKGLLWHPVGRGSFQLLFFAMEAIATQIKYLILTNKYLHLGRFLLVKVLFILASTAEE